MASKHRAISLRADNLVKAAGGIGQAAALSFAEAGILSLVFADVDFEKAKEAAEKSKQYATNKQYGTLAVGVDVTNESSVQAMVNAAVAEFGRLDYCVNSAGVRFFKYIPGAVLYSY